MSDQQTSPLTRLAKSHSRAGFGDPIFQLLAIFFGLVVVGLVFTIGIVTWNASADARASMGLDFLWTSGWAPNKLIFGALPAVYGTLLTAAIAVVLAAPLGIFIGIYLSELAPLRFRQPLSFLVELLAAIPSVIYGMWGVMVLVPWFRDEVA